MIPVHLGIKFVCNLCAYRAPYTENLREHMRIHKECSGTTVVRVWPGGPPGEINTKVKRIEIRLERLHEGVLQYENQTPLKAPGTQDQQSAGAKGEPESKRKGVGDPVISSKPVAGKMISPPGEDHASGNGAGGTSPEEWSNDGNELNDLDPGSSDSPARGQAWSVLPHEVGAA